MTADKSLQNENQPRKLIFCININVTVYIKIQVNLFFISAVVSYQQLPTADDIFFILVVISCQQLKTVDENEKIFWYTYHLTSVYKTFSSSFSVSAVICY